METVDQGTSNRGGKRTGAGRPKSDRDDTVVKLDRGVAEDAKFLAGIEGVSIAEFLSEHLREPLKKLRAKEDERHRRYQQSRESGRTVQ